MRGVADGKPFADKVKYKPTIYVCSTERHKSPFHTLHGQSVAPITFDSIKECRSWLDEQKGIVNAPTYYGHTQNFIYPYLGETYPDDLNPNLSKIRTVIVDIEVASEDGFSETDDASEEITAITIKEMGANTSVSFGCGDFNANLRINENQANIIYIKCENEHELLERFIDTWQAINPDVVTGWNVELYLSLIHI